MVDEFFLFLETFQKFTYGFMVSDIDTRRPTAGEYSCAMGSSKFYDGLADATGTSNHGQDRSFKPVEINIFVQGVSAELENAVGKVKVFRVCDLDVSPLTWDDEYLAQPVPQDQATVVGHTNLAFPHCERVSLSDDVKPESLWGLPSPQDCTVRNFFDQVVLIDSDDGVRWLDGDVDCTVGLESVQDSINDSGAHEGPDGIVNQDVPLRFWYGADSDSGAVQPRFSAINDLHEFAISCGRKQSLDLLSNGGIDHEYDAIDSWMSFQHIHYEVHDGLAADLEKLFCGIVTGSCSEATRKDYSKVFHNGRTPFFSPVCALRDNCAFTFILQNLQIVLDLSCSIMNIVLSDQGKERI